MGMFYQNKITQELFQIIFLQGMQKQVIVIVDNRLHEESVVQQTKNVFRGSAFKATEIDSIDHIQMSNNILDEHNILQHLQEKIDALEKRVNDLEGSFKQERIKRRFRRKAKQISREYKCHHKDCQKFYGSETSLKNHLKLKHGRRSLEKLAN